MSVPSAEEHKRDTMESAVKRKQEAPNFQEQVWLDRNARRV